jgi:uncharacterized protein (TIGR01777 family)
VRIAITGSTGLIGSALTDALRADGHTVTRITRAPSREPDAITWDIDAGRIDTARLESHDAVVHLAGAGIGDHRWTEDYKREVRESRTKGTTLLASALASLDARPRVLVSGSAQGYYGDRGDEVLTEASRKGEGFLADVVAAWEDGTSAAREAGIRTATIRSTLVLAAHGGALRRMLPLFRLGLGGRMGSGRQWWSWITLQDHVRAIRWLIEHENVNGPVNLAAPNPVTNADFTRALARALRRPAFFAVPKAGPRLVLGRGLTDQLLFTSLRVVPSVLVEHGFTFEHPTIDEAMRAVVGASR